MKTFSLIFCFAMILVPSPGTGQTVSGLPSVMSEATAQCIDCHSENTPNIYQQWGASKHFRGNVGCFECHEAQAGDKDAFEHNGFLISVIVSPKDCGRCHANEVAEFENSHHSKAGRILGSLDNTLAEVVEGNRNFKTPGFPGGISAAAVNGCWQCHGSEVKVLPGGKLDAATWPNTGMGRINPDGSEGSCSACHHRHEFSVAQARRPENCGKCHMGPDHPQIEIYEESKHGIEYHANESKMNLESAKWIVGEDYFAAPTCATCHMSATTDMPVTHNVGLRIKWNNRPAISIQAHETDKKWGLKSAEITGDQRMQNMKNVCASCHNENFADNFYLQYEGLLDLYHEKFGKPGLELYGLATNVLKAVKGTAYAQFAQKIDYTWFELWHHEGRRARHAASMQGPDWTHWHGTYDLAKNWYGEYVPELQEVIELGKLSGNPSAVEAAGNLETALTRILNSPDHQWSIGREDPAVKEERAKRKKEFLDRYNK